MGEEIVTTAGSGQGESLGESALQQDRSSDPRSEHCHHIIRQLKQTRINQRKEDFHSKELEAFISDDLQFVVNEDAVALLKQVGLHRAARPPSIRQYSRSIKDRTNELRPSELCECLRSFGMLHSDDTELYEALEARIAHVLTSSRDIQTLDDRELTLCALGLGEARRNDSVLRKPLINEAIARTSHFEPKQVSTFLWAISPIVDKEEMTALWPIAERCRNFTYALKDRESMRLLQLAGEMHDLAVDFVPERFKLTDAPFVSNAPLNRFEQNVQDVLESFGMNPNPQVKVFGVSADFFITAQVGSQLKSVVIFCDGQRYHHLGWNAANQICGSDYVQSEVLKKRGFAVLRIPDLFFPEEFLAQQDYLIQGLVQSQSAESGYR